jgi:hypothetical protein
MNQIVNTTKQLTFIKLEALHLKGKCKIWLMWILTESIKNIGP